MSNLQKYQISAAHIAAVRASGFDARDPDARHPVHNPTAEKILAARGRTAATRSLQQDPRVTALLRAKDGLVDRIRGRGLGLLLTTALAGSIASHAWAVPPGDLASETTSFVTILKHIVTGFGVMLSAIPGPRDPAWLTALLSGTFATQLFQIRSRRSANMAIRTHPQSDTTMMIEPHAPIPISEPLPLSSHTWHLDGASRVGKARSENQDAYRLLPIEGGKMAMFLCDGAGGVAGGKLAAETAAEALAAHIGAMLDRPGDPHWPSVAGEAMESARRAVEAQGEAGITTAIVAVLGDDQLHYATLGDGALLVVWPDGMTQEVLVPHHVLGRPSNEIAAYIGQGCTVPPRIGSLRLEPGCFVIAMSDGAGDIFPRNSFAEARESCQTAMRDPAISLASQLLQQLEAARDPENGAYLHSDNLTLLIGLLEKSEAGDV